MNETSAATWTYRFLLPRYWLIWIAYWMLWFIVRLPHRARIGFGEVLGALGYRLAASRRHIVDTNLRLCFPELDVDARRALAKRTFRSGGISIVETAISWIGRRDAVYGRSTIEGLEELKAAQARGKGVILLGVHMSTLDIAGTVMARQIMVDVMYRANPNDLIEWIMTSGRRRMYPSAIERGDIRHVIASLKAGHIVWYGPDQDYGPRNAVFVPFVGVTAATTTAVSRLAKMTGAAVVPYTHFRENNDAHYSVIIRPALVDFPGDSVEADATRVNQWVEESILRCPEQYWWFHRRFKTRPDGEAGVY